MAFINELVPKEDIEKYGLDELYLHYSRLAGDSNAARWGMIGLDSWIVDREKERWFFRAGQGTVADIPPMATGEDYYILHYKERNIEVLMHENRKEWSKKFSDNPFRIRWEILSVKPESFEDISTEEIINIITEAMTARGDRDIEKFVEAFDVQVKYIGGQN
jgi:hypothetical protein